ncbi:MAG: energy-coupling factor transporter transmembrane component T, partial [Anaerolineae bacterium]|nr:energy-coupling factor transporter transmembrane component T [Anaerolineae bacterium]
MMKKRITSFPVYISDSPLRSIDPRVKMVISMASSLAVMMPLRRLIVFMGIFTLFLLWAKLIHPSIQQISRIKYLLITLFILDTLIVNVNLAFTVTLRLILLAGVFTLFVATTTADELRLTLERMRVPYRFAFSLSMAFQSVDILQQEWHAIHEAQI